MGKTLLAMNESPVKAACAKSAWAAPPRLVRAALRIYLPQGKTMAADQANDQVAEMDYPAHERNYSGFLRLLKISMVIVAIIAAIVITIIAN